MPTTHSLKPYLLFRPQVLPELIECVTAFIEHFHPVASLAADQSSGPAVNARLVRVVSECAETSTDSAVVAAVNGVKNAMNKKGYLQDASTLERILG